MVINFVGNDPENVINFAGSSRFSLITIVGFCDFIAIKTLIPDEGKSVILALIHPSPQLGRAMGPERLVSSPH